MGRGTVIKRNEPSHPFASLKQSAWHLTQADLILVAFV